MKKGEKTTIQVSIDLWKHIKDEQRLGETREDTLRRLIGMERRKK